MKKFLITSFAFICLLSAPAYSQFTIEQLAPENTIIVTGSDDVGNAFERVKRTSLWRLWKSKEIQDMTAEVMEEMASNLKTMYEELGVDEDALIPPDGAAGFALNTLTDEETGASHIALFAFADYGENADKFSELIDAFIQKIEEDNDLEFDEEELLGRTVRVIEIPEQMDEDMDEDFGFDDFGGNPFLPDVGAITDQVSVIYYLREGSLFLAASDLDNLRPALEAIDGEEAEVLGNREDFHEARNQLGEVDGYGLILTRDFGDLMAAVDDSGMIQMMIGQSVEALIGKIGAIGYGYHMDGRTAMLEQTMTIYMPEGKGGIFALMDMETPRSDLPSFVGTDAISYTSVNFKFDGVLEFIRNVINSNPMLAMQLGPQMPAIEEFINGFCNPLGSRMHLVGTIRRPIEADSMNTVVAIECRNQEQFEEFIVESGSALGMEPRDFLGHRIYVMDQLGQGMGMALPSISLGIGGGFLFLGTSVGVEQALRTTGQKHLAGLADDEEYQRAISALADGLQVGWGYSDYLTSLEVTRQVARKTMKESIEQMEEFDPEMAAEMKEELEEAGNVLDKLDVKLLKRFLGPSSWSVRSTDRGFVMTTLLLDASDAD